MSQYLAVVGPERLWEWHQVDATRVIARVAREHTRYVDRRRGRLNL